ncbi:hypothetical protein [Shewanella baltica]|uniref:hypothetical protein n=1 Tax=Shewanella baltica TaxID=62322 RepID=UPI0006647EBC|nr:hypothetical protein [Shewanella baltica]
MQLQVIYDEKFSTNELDKLRSFECIIREIWIKNSNSTSSLIWEVVVKAEEPRLYALLKTQSNHQKIHLESCASILNKSSDSFQSEFFEASCEYLRQKL